MSLIVKAKVIDSSTQRPMANVNVFVSDSKGNQVTHNGVPNVGRTTDGNGNFILPVAFADDFITISHIGYQTLTIPSESAANKSQFIMRTLVQDLPEAVINGTRPRSIPRATPIKTASVPTINKKTWLIVGGVIAGVSILGIIIYLSFKK